MWTLASSCVLVFEMVSSIARNALFGASLLLVGLAVFADASPQRPTVGDLTRGWKPTSAATARAGVASVFSAQQEGYEGYNGGDSSYHSHGSSAGSYGAPAVEEKDVCLVENFRRNCYYLEDFYYLHAEYS